jgi:hypothetical protein
MPEQELNLLQLPAAVVAQLRASSPQVVWCDVFQPHSLATSLHDVPDYILRNAFSPYLSRFRYCAKYSSFRNSCCLGPLIECRFGPFRNRDRADVPPFADQIHYRPMPLTDLDLIQLQANQF